MVTIDPIISLVAAQAFSAFAGVALVIALSRFFPGGRARIGAVLCGSACVLGFLIWWQYRGMRVSLGEFSAYGAGAAAAAGIAFLVFYRSARWRTQAISPGKLTHDFGISPGVHLRHVLQMAVRVEEKGLQFYKMYSEVTRDFRVKELVTRIISEEAKHKQLLLSMLAQWKPLAENGDIFERFDTEMKVRRIFFSMPNKYASEDEIIAYAIEQEKKLVDFYKGFEHAFPQGWKRLNIQALVVMERTHVNDLKNIRKSLNTTAKQSPSA